MSSGSQETITGFESDSQVNQTEEDDLKLSQNLNQTIK